MGGRTRLWGPRLVPHCEVQESITAKASGDRTDHSGIVGTPSPSSGEALGGGWEGWRVPVLRAGLCRRR